MKLEKNEMKKWDGMREWDKKRDPAKNIYM